MDPLVPLSSPEGGSRMAKAGTGARSVVAAWRHQIGKSCCGAASLAICLSSVAPAGASEARGGGGTAAGGEGGVQAVTEDDVLERLETAQGSGGAPLPEAVRTGGMTLEECERAALTVPGVRSATRLHCGGAEAVGGGFGDADALRDVLTSALGRADAGGGEGGVSARVILNYHMETLGQKCFYGHLSPVAAYDAATDSFLIQDTWPETEPVWATAASVFAAASVVDEASCRPRGVLILELEAGAGLRSQ